MSVVSSDGKFIEESHMGDKRNPVDLDSSWKSWICTWWRRGKGESKVTPGCQRECLGDGGTIHQDPECRRLGTFSHSFPFQSVPGRVDFCGCFNWAPSPCDIWLGLALGQHQQRSEGGKRKPRRVFIPWLPPLQTASWHQLQALSCCTLGAWNYLLRLQSGRAMAPWHCSCKGTSSFLVDLLLLCPSLENGFFIKLSSITLFEWVVCFPQLFWLV